MIQRITKMYTRRCRDSGQVTTYIEWIDHKGKKGRTEGSADNGHMKVLIARGLREGLKLIRETL